jgi:hypothetical protein
MTAAQDYYISDMFYQRSTLTAITSWVTGRRGIRLTVSYPHHKLGPTSADGLPLGPVGDRAKTHFDRQVKCLIRTVLSPRDGRCVDHCRKGDLQLDMTIRLSAAEQVRAASEKTLPSVVIDASGKVKARSTKLDFHASSRMTEKGR